MRHLSIFRRDPRYECLTFISPAIGGYLGAKKIDSSTAMPNTNTVPISTGSRVK